jgi:transposase-like protein
MSRVKDVSAASLVGFVEAAVSPGAVVHTDGWPAYKAVAARGYDHRPRNLSASDDPAHVVMPRVHGDAALLDRWWLGTHQGAISPKHLDYYLDEYTFRFNRRRSHAPGLLFYRLLEQSLTVDPVAYRSLVGGKPRQSKKPGNPKI